MPQEERSSDAVLFLMIQEKKNHDSSHTFSQLEDTFKGGKESFMV